MDLWTFTGIVNMITYCFLAALILFVNFSSEIGSAVCTIAAVTAIMIRLIIQIPFRNKVPDNVDEDSLIPVIKMDRFSFSVVWFAMFTTIAIIAGVNGVLPPLLIMFIALITWWLLIMFLYVAEARFSTNAIL